MSRSLSTALRPYLHKQVKQRHRDVYLRFYAAAKAATRTAPTSQSAVTPTDDNVDSLWSSISYRKRLKQLTALHPHGQKAPTDLFYPLIGSKDRLKPAEFRCEAEKLGLEPGQWAKQTRYHLHGKVSRVRAMGRKLI